MKFKSCLKCWHATNIRYKASLSCSKAFLSIINEFAVNVTFKTAHLTTSLHKLQQKRGKKLKICDYSILLRTLEVCNFAKGGDFFRSAKTCGIVRIQTAQKSYFYDIEVICKIIIFLSARTVYFSLNFADYSTGCNSGGN